MPSQACAGDGGWGGGGVVGHTHKLRNSAKMTQMCGMKMQQTDRRTCCSSFLSSSILEAIHLKLKVPRPFDRFFASSEILATDVLNFAISVSSARTVCSDLSA
jgi:hypothetical protein